MTRKMIEKMHREQQAFIAGVTATVVVYTTVNYLKLVVRTFKQIGKESE